MPFFKNKKRKTKGKRRIQEFRSPYLNKSILRTKRLPKRGRIGKSMPSSTRKGPLKKALWISTSVVFLLFIIYSTAFSQFFEIQQWKIFEDDVIQEGSAFEKYISPKRGRNLIFLNTNKIEDTILEEHPHIKVINLKKVYPHTLVLEYKYYDEVANIINKLDGAQKKLIINEKGNLVKENIESPTLPYIIIHSEEALEVNTNAIEEGKLEYILDAIYEYEELFGMKIIDVEYKKDEREIHLKTEKDFYIWLDTGQSLSLQYKKLKKALPKLNIYNESLVYIDLRVSGVNGEKVIFKRK